MNQDKYVFAQLVSFLDNIKFRRVVAKYDGDRYVKSYTCLNQLLTMMFGQLSGHESLRDLVVAMEAHSGKLYHLGMGKSVTRSNLAKANEGRDYRIFEEFATFMIEQAMTKRKSDIFKLGGSVYAFDSITIDLCLNVFWWATYKRQKGAIKLHTLYDVRTQFSDFIIVTPASVNDVNSMDYIEYQTGSYYIFDREYNDFARLDNIHIREAFFVFRAREKIRFRRIYSIKKEPDTGIKSDQTGVLTQEIHQNDTPKRYAGFVITIPSKTESLFC